MTREQRLPDQSQSRNRCIWKETFWELPAPRRLDHARETVHLGKDWVVGPNPKFSDLVERLLRRFPLDASDSLWAEPPDGTTPHKVMRLSIQRSAPAFRHMLAWSVLDMHRSHQGDSSDRSGIKLPQSAEEKQYAIDPLELNFLEPGVGMAWSADGTCLSEETDAGFDKRIHFTPQREPEEDHDRLVLLRQRTAEAQPARAVPMTLANPPRTHLLHAKSNLLRAFLKHEDGWFRALAYRRSETFLRRTWANWARL